MKYLFEKKHDISARMLYNKRPTASKISCVIFLITNRQNTYIIFHLFKKYIDSVLKGIGFKELFFQLF